MNVVQSVANGISLFMLTYKIKDFRLWRHTRAKAYINLSIMFGMKSFQTNDADKLLYILTCWCYFSYSFPEFSHFAIFATESNWKTNLNQQLKLLLLDVSSNTLHFFCPSNHLCYSYGQIYGIKISVPYTIHAFVSLEPKTSMRWLGWMT